MHVFNFDNILPTAIQKVCFINWNLYKHMRMPVYSCPSQHWLLLIFFIFLNLIGKKWHLIDVLIYVSLIAREAQHFLKRCFYLLFWYSQVVEFYTIKLIINFLLLATKSIHFKSFTTTGFHKYLFMYSGILVASFFQSKLWNIWNLVLYKWWNKPHTCFLQCLSTFPTPIIFYWMIHLINSWFFP